MSWVDVVLTVYAASLLPATVGYVRAIQQSKYRETANAWAGTAAIMLWPITLPLSYLTRNMRED